MRQRRSGEVSRYSTKFVNTYSSTKKAEGPPKKPLYNGLVGERNQADLKHPLSLNIGGYTFKQSTMPAKKPAQVNNLVGPA